jgi:hypothetical protein
MNHMNLEDSDNEGTGIWSKGTWRIGTWTWRTVTWDMHGYERH